MALHATKVAPDNVDAHYLLGNALSDLNLWDEAFVSYQRALKLKPDFAEVYYNLGRIYRNRGEFEQTVAVCRRALELRPNFAEAYNDLGAALQSLKQFDEAMNCYQRAIEIRPNYGLAHFNASQLLLKRGDFLSGWQEHEWRWRGGIPHLIPRSFSKPQWRGERMDGKTLLVYGEQGFGDIIQFIRYATVAAGYGARVIVEVPEALARIAVTVEGVAEVVVTGEKLPRYDRQIAMMSVPLAVGTLLETIPANVPYLHADPAMTAVWAKRAEDWAGLKVGLVWAGNPNLGGPNSKADSFRSLSLEQLLPVLKVPDVTFVSLQKENAANQIAELPKRLRPLDLSSEINDFADTAALIANLDLVIGVDTSTVHLAGAIGKPAWMFSRYYTDSRWLMDRDDSPWYPTLRLFRQTKFREWDDVIQRVAIALRQSARAPLRKGEIFPSLASWRSSNLLKRLRSVQ